MADISFDEFVNQQVAKAKPSTDCIQERDNWIHHLDKFYQLVKGFLRKYIEQDKVHIAWTTKQINEEYIGTYEVASLEVLIGAVKVHFDPIGTNLIGAKGRVDMHGPHGTVKFVLVPKTASAVRVIVQEFPIAVADDPITSCGGVDMENIDSTSEHQVHRTRRGGLSFCNYGSRKCLTVKESLFPASTSNLPKSIDITVTSKHP